MENIFNKSLESLTDFELLEVLDLVSGEIKKRNQLMKSGESPEDLAEKLMKALFPRP